MRWLSCSSGASVVDVKLAGTDGNPDFLSDDLVNFEKCEILSRIIGKFMAYSSGHYQLAPLLSVQRFIVEFSVDLEGYVYERSLELEPRASQPAGPSAKVGASWKRGAAKAAKLSQAASAFSSNQ